ncbi:hypothetical protein EDB85DRAFT_2139011 [Lactarius pseudohatsudake]|nr:hypothetical protein EDB85DRAFT_2139011 [Lactarius pseudohatsudake]
MSVTTYMDIFSVLDVELSARYTWMPNINSLDFVNDPVETGPYHNQDPQQIRRPNVGLYALMLAHKNQIYLEYENRLCGILDMLKSLDATNGKESMEDRVLQELIGINRLKGLEWSGRHSKRGVNGAMVNTESYFVTRHPQNLTLHAIYMTTLVIAGRPPSSTPSGLSPRAPRDHMSIRGRVSIFDLDLLR